MSEVYPVDACGIPIVPMNPGYEGDPNARGLGKSILTRQTRPSLLILWCMINERIHGHTILVPVFITSTCQSSLVSNWFVYLLQHAPVANHPHSHWSLQHHQLQQKLTLHYYGWRCMRTAHLVNKVHPVWRARRVRMVHRVRAARHLVRFLHLERMANLAQIELAM